MQHVLVIRKGVDLSMLNRAVVALGQLREVNRSSTLYHTYVSWLNISKDAGILLSDIGTSKEEVLELCRLGSLNVIKQFQKLLGCGRKVGLESVVTPAVNTIRDEVECGHVTLEDLRGLGLLREFSIYLPQKGRAS